MEREFVVDFSEFYGSDLFSEVKIKISEVENVEEEIFVSLFLNDNSMFSIHFGGMKFDENDDNIIEGIKSFGRQRPFINSNE